MLSCVLQKFERYKVIPFYNLQIPAIRKRGHPYQTDFVIRTSSSNSDDEEVEELCASTGTNVTTVKSGSNIIMVIEVKKSVATSFLQIDMQDTVEMLIYCYYILKNYEQENTAGVLTDGYNWHCLCLCMPKGTDGLELVKYTVFSSVSEKEVLNHIPSLLHFAD